MAPIKSALELALEKTKDLKVDKAAIALREARQEGKKLAGDFLNKPDSFDLGKAVKSIAADRRDAVKAGAFDVLASNIQLPASKTSDVASSFATLARGFSALNATPFGEKKIESLFTQLANFMTQYIEDMTNVEAALRKQFEPKLRRKEQELAARTGQAVRMDPMADPEFAAFYQQNAGKLKGQYQAALDQAKEDLAALLGVKREEA